MTDDISHDCLLGTDFLIAHKFNIVVLEQNKIFFGGVKVMYNNYYNLYSLSIDLCS